MCLSAKSLALVLAGFIAVASNPAAATSNAMLARYYETQLSQAQFSLVAYVVDHPAPTMALVAMGGGYAAALTDHLDQDTRNVLNSVVVGGALYCIFNADDCGTAINGILYRLNEVQRLEQTLVSLR